MSEMLFTIQWCLRSLCEPRNGLGRCKSLHFFTNNATLRTVWSQKMRCLLSAAVLAHSFWIALCAVCGVFPFIALLEWIMHQPSTVCL